MPSYEPIQVIVVTPGQFLIGFAVWVAITLAAVAFGVWVFGGGRRDDYTGVVDSVEAAQTQELPRRLSRPRTGTIHASQYQRPVVDEPTVVIETGARR